MRPARILVVDDEPGMLRAVERVLGEDHHVLGTRLSRDALAVAEDLCPDLAIVDIRMPDLDGFELMTQLKARFPALDVILMTGSVDDLDEKLVRAIRSPAFYFIQKPFDREVLRTLVERCVELRWRREEHRQNVMRLEGELAQARAFQQSLLPEREAVVNGVSISCRYTPSAALGGDLFDYASAPGGRTALLIADVSGHGVSAAMLTGIVKSAFHASHGDGFEPAAVAQRVATALAAFSAERFVTLVAALLSPEEQQLRYVNAGHPAVLFWGNGRAARWLESTGPLISPAFPVRLWNAESVPIDDGDHLLLYTDGVSETLAGDDGASDARFTSAVAQAPDGGARLLEVILGEVERALDGRVQPDDVTLLTASVFAPAAP